MKVTVEKEPKATLKITVIIPAEKVKEEYNHVLDHYVESAEIQGFRKGKAPRDLVEKNIKEAEFNGEVVNHMLQEFYIEALKENKIMPIGNPKVLIKKYDKNSEFEFEATVAIRPEIKLKGYKEKIKTAYESKKKENLTLEINDLIDAIRDSTEVEFSDLLLEEEVNRMLSRLLEQAETLGLSVEQYLSAQNKKIEDLRKEYEEAAKKGLKGEFALSQAIEEEKIEVTNEEIEEAINALPDPKLRERLQNPQDKWYIKSVLLKNKLLSKLLNDVSEGDVKKEEPNDTTKPTIKSEESETKPDATKTNE